MTGTGEIDVAVVDSGGANLTSVLFALERLGARARLSRDPDEISRAPRVLLPGVGAAPACMKTLQERGLVDCLRELRQPALGICLGMQLLYESSSEGGGIECLRLIPGAVTALQATEDLPVPHMGWNRVRSPAPCALLESSGEGDFFYFVHSFVAPPGGAVVASAEYGVLVPAVVQWKNWFGAQFHPERSGEAGARLLRRFLELGA